MLTERISVELNRRNIYYKFDVTTYWGWGVLGSAILVGPVIYLHKLLQAMNLLSFDYNNNDNFVI